MSSRFTKAVVVIALTFAFAGCDEGHEEAVSPRPQFDLMADAEGEVLVQVFENGVPTTATDLTLELVPLDNTEDRLHGTNELMMQIGKKRQNNDWMAEWFDPDASDGPCGPIENYETGNDLLRGDEVHGGVGPEVHCIRPGHYRAILRRNGMEIRRTEVEYVQIAVNAAGGNEWVVNSTANLSEKLISPLYQPRGGENAITDLILNIDLQSDPSFSDNAVIDIDTAGANPGKLTFQNIDYPEATDQDYFRMSVAQSTSNWTRPDVIRGSAMLTRYWWDRGSPGYEPTGYIDAHGASHLLAAHRYGDEVQQSRQARLAVDHKRPDELPSNIPQIERTIQVNKSVVLPDDCLTAENENTWLMTDQYLTVGCAPRGTGISYEWQFSSGGPITTTTDTLFDFRGHSTGGQQLVSLAAKSGATTLGTWSRVFDVLGTQNVISGPTGINNKNTQTYSSPSSGDWYERFNPQIAWVGSAIGTDTVTRIWPEGDYTVEMRQELQDSPVLQRGRLSIEVCAACGPELFVASMMSGEMSALFGAGPVLTWGSGVSARAISLYDLFGMHEAGSPFATKAWLARAGEFTAGPFQISWSPVPSSVEGVDLYDFEVTPLQADGYAFGFAVDPDLGSRAADDQAHYDPERRLVYVMDAAEAFGILILDGKTPATIGVQQFGAARLPPGNAAATIAAQRGGIRLIDTTDDVQFLMSTARRTKGDRFTVAFIQGSDAAQVRARSDDLVESR